MTEIAMKLECRGCGSSVEYSAKDQTTRCPYCGTLTEIPKVEEELPDQPSFLIPLSVETSELTDAVYAHLASGDMTPDELLEFATFTKKERFYTPVYVYVGAFEAQWTASFGYDRWEEYTAYEKRTEDGRTYNVPVTKTRRVTDWRPVNGTDTGNFKVLGYAGTQLLDTGIDAVSLVESRETDEAVSFDSSYTTGIQIEPYVASEDDVYRERAESQVSAIIDQSVREHAQGDHQRDWHWTAQTEKNSTTMLVPICHATFEYQGKPYHVWASGTNASRLIADELPVDHERRQSIKFGYFPLVVSVIASLWAVFGLHYNWMIPVAVVVAFGLYGVLRKKAIIRYSREVRSWLLANKKAAESNTAAMTDAQQRDVAKSMERPQRPLLSHTSHDRLVIPLVILLAAVLPFSQYLVSPDASPQTQYNAQQYSSTSSAPPVSVPVAPAVQNRSAPSGSEGAQVPELPVAAAEQSNDSGTLENTPVQRNPQQARKLNAQGLKALAGPHRDLVVAKDLFQKAVQLDPEYVEALNNLGDVYGLQEDYKAAETILAKVLAMAPNRRVAHGNMGYVEAKMGNIDQAEIHFCEYIHGFTSFENGMAKLKGSFTDPDPQVQSAVALTISNCRP